MKFLKELEVPLIWIYNYIMIIKKEMKEDLIIDLNMVSEWYCRGDRGIGGWSEKVNIDLIRRVWDSRNDDDFEEDGVELNSIEERILVGDGGFIWDDDEDYSNSKRGISGCMKRVDDLLEGKSVGIECEEEMFMIGSIVDNELDIDFCKWKIELLKA